MTNIAVAVGVFLFLDLLVIWLVLARRGTRPGVPDLDGLIRQASALHPKAARLTDALRRRGHDGLDAAVAALASSVDGLAEALRNHPRGDAPMARFQDVRPALSGELLALEDLVGQLAHGGGEGTPADRLAFAKAGADRARGLLG